MAISDFRFDNLPRSIQIVVFTTLVVCLAAVFYMFYLKDQIEQHNGIQADIKSLEQSVAQGTAIESRLKHFKQELAQLEDRLAVLKSILPAQKERRQS